MRFPHIFAENYWNSISLVTDDKVREEVEEKNSLHLFQNFDHKLNI